MKTPTATLSGFSVYSIRAESILAGSLLDEADKILPTNHVKICGPRMDAPPMQLALGQRSYMVVKVDRKGAGPLLEQFLKARKRKTWPHSIRICGPAGGGNFSGTLFLQIGEPGQPDDLGRVTKKVADECACWLLSLKGVVDVEHYRPDLLLDADDYSMEALFDIQGRPDVPTFAVAPANATSAAAMLV